MAIFIAVAVFISTLPGTAHAQSKYHPGVIGSDDRRIIDSSDHPWGAIGHVNISGFRSRSMCTGTLIAPNVVLTAAHCLVHPRTLKPQIANDVHFLAGVRREERLGHSKARCVKFHRDYDFANAGKKSVQMKRSHFFKIASTDLAVIVLAKDLPVRPLEIAKHSPVDDGVPLVHASYPADRRFLLSADSQCKLLLKSNGIWGTSCDTHHGSSGGPVLLEEGGGLRLGAVMVGTINHELTVAVPIPTRGELSLDNSCN